jgi:alpha-beta hydrolase superfamily lysophospholipase
MQLIAEDNHKLNIYCWDKVQSPKAVLQVFHGMSEHAGRYEGFAQFLNSNGIIVYANDLRGHGKTASYNGKLGYLGEDGFNRIVKDEYRITQQIKQEYPNLPVFILGHSFGSFVGQEYMTKYSNEIEGMILCGSAFQKGLKFKFARILAAVYTKIYGENKEAGFLHQLTFASYNKRIPNAEINDWLSRDPEIVTKYNSDPECGFICFANFYYYFTNALTKLYKSEKMMQISKDLPILIISGAEDPVGNYGKSVDRLYKLYQHLGIKDVEISLYKGARHELLNETNKEEVFRDILMWLDKHNT